MTAQKFVYEGIVHAVVLVSKYTTTLACGWLFEYAPTDADRAETRPIGCLECLATLPDLDRARRDGARRDGHGAPSEGGDVRPQPFPGIGAGNLRLAAEAFAEARTQEELRQLSVVSERRLTRAHDGVIHYQRSLEEDNDYKLVMYTVCDLGLRVPRRVPPEVTTPTCLECLAWAP